MDLQHFLLVDGATGSVHRVRRDMREHPEERGTHVFIGGLPLCATEKDIFQLFVDEPPDRCTLQPVAKAECGRWNVISEYAGEPMSQQSSSPPQAKKPFDPELLKMLEGHESESDRGAIDRHTEDVERTTLTYAGKIIFEKTSETTSDIGGVTGVKHKATLSKDMRTLTVVSRMLLNSASDEQQTENFRVDDLIAQHDAKASVEDQLAVTFAEKHDWCTRRHLRYCVLSWNGVVRPEVLARLASSATVCGNEVVVVTLRAHIETVEEALCRAQVKPK